MKTAMTQMLDELMAHEYTIPIGLIVKCKELIEVEKMQMVDATVQYLIKHRGMHSKQSILTAVELSEQYYNETYTNGL
jgi:hypothetical protein